MKQLSRFVLYTSLVGALCLALVVSYLPAPKAEALTAANWKAGRIIDDAIFFNKGSMTPQQIQDFLNAKVPTCDRNHQAFFWLGGVYNQPPYTCLKEYNENPTTQENNIGRFNADGSPVVVSGGKSAAQIIWDAAQLYSINPQVLLVMLQKETAIVTDPWSATWQYDRAMGYACPDTGVGGSANCDTSYYGFYNQVTSAAKQMRRYVTYPDSYNFKAGVTRNIQWDVPTSCGSSPVYIETQGTAILYNYTPYQPNATALSNLYGAQDDGCSAYGNRNFWVYFTNWFGSTIGSLLRTVDSPNLYLSDGTYRYVVPSMSIVEQYGYTLSNVKFVSQAELDSTPIASAPLSSSLGLVVKSPDDSDGDGGAVYLISGGKRIPISTIDQFIDFGLTSQSIAYLSLDVLNAVPISNANLSNFVQTPDLSVYKIDDGKKHAIFELSKLAQLNQQGDLAPLSFATLSSLQYGPPLVDDDFVIIATNGAVRLYPSASEFYSVPNMDIYGCLSLKRIKTFRVSSFDITGGGTKGNASCYVKGLDGLNYIMATDKKYLFPGTLDAPTISVSPNILSPAITTTLRPVVKASTPALFVFEDGKLRAIPTMTIYTSLGYGGASITQLPDSVIGSLHRGGDKLSIGTIGLHSGGGVSVITGAGARYQIESVQQFNAFSFKWSNAVRVSSQTEQSYPSSATLPYFVKAADVVYLIDGGVRYLVDATLDSSYGLNRATIPAFDQSIVSSTLQWNLSKFIKTKNSAAIYFMDAGQKRPIMSWQRVVELGGANSIVVLSDMRVNSIPTGTKL